MPREDSSFEILQMVEIFRVFRQFGKELDLDSTEQSFRGPKTKAYLHDALWSRVFAHLECSGNTEMAIGSMPSV